jgi:hypothetical protein
MRIEKNRLRDQYKRSKFHKLISFAGWKGKYVNRVVYWGKHYGYPQCCIKSFLSNNEKTTNQKKCLDDNKRFVPCSFHADLIVSGKKTVEQLIRKRKHKSLFPIDDDLYRLY